MLRPASCQRPVRLRAFRNHATIDGGWLMAQEEGTMLGAYGGWFAERLPDPPALSFRRPEHGDLPKWREEALAKVHDLVASPSEPLAVKPRLIERSERDGLAVERLAWQLPFGPPTEALFLKPARSAGRIPGVLALHDHGARKFFGKQKITRSGIPLHPLVAEHQEHYYGGRAWANELARRGYGVLVHDVFAFESRAIRYAEVPPEIRSSGRTETVGGIAGGGASAVPKTIEEILEYDRWAAAQETTIAKSLFSAGATWPGVFLLEDRAALGYLMSRDDVDSERIGCGGLSGGGLRTVYLAGTDARVKAAVCAGFMTTWRDFLLAKSWTHTWMAYTPLLPNYLDFPDLFSLRVPLPTLVLNCAGDGLFSPQEMERAAAALREVYAKAGAADRLTVSSRPGGHRFDTDMQEEAFDFLDRWLA